MVTIRGHTLSLIIEILAIEEASPFLLLTVGSEVLA
jgi:hypothetical protein